MKIFKKIITALVVLILVLLYIPRHLSPHFSMSRAIVIKVPVAEVFKRLPDLNEYNNWNPFSENDSTQVTGTGVNSFMTWKGKDSGEGKMTIVEIEPNHKIKIKMDFYKPMKGEAVVYWITVPTADGNTEFKWTYDQDLPYLNRYFGLVMDRMMGKYFEKGLVKYKAIVEGSLKQ